jgi:hypothetical protein
VGGAFIAALLCAACDHGPEADEVPARAARSVHALPSPQREAAGALVRLESKARDRDGEALCESVYLFAGGPPDGCQDQMRRLFPTDRGYSIAVRSVRFAGPGQAFAKAVVVTTTPSGSHERFPDTTFKLRRHRGAWRVVFLT